ncbi:isoleucine--tRNA ligase [Legionella sp. W05-934-2]|uniref:isoleucine--tRNA ligase n=1 Tax=Legionella sp. W05-934-2 TaxID=1198649 RepID=UPI0034621BEF
MTDYKSTLNLPTTEFPMKASLSQREPQRLEDWDTSGLYQAMSKEQAQKPLYVLHDGPPYANGHLHCGHALNKILKDITVKSKVMSGYRAPFVPGWDCHGLPIELNVEKKVGKAGHKLSVSEFREKCREYASSQIDIQRNEFKRLGVFGDWNHPYLTMDFRYEADILRSLAQIIANGHLHQGFKPVHWCIECGSALAEAEVEYDDKQSPSIDVAFIAVDANEALKRFGDTSPTKPVVIPIWTTTPWTLPANEAVCVHPKLDYVLVDTKQCYFVVCADLCDDVMARYGIESFEKVAVCQGNVLESMSLKHPLFDKKVPVLLGEHVTTESGTGCVHTAPAHGPDDYAVAVQYNIEIHNPIMQNGCFVESLPLFGGLHINKAQQPILERLQHEEVLLSHQSILHSYPHCWRHKTPTIFLATPQWFISMDKNGLREQILAEINRVQWLPEWGKERMAKMVENRPDWCISRQRSWGTPMPLFIHRETRELHPQTVNLIEKVAQKVETNGIDAWFDLNPEELLGKDASEYEKMTDTLDVWFDSGVSHYTVLKQRQELGYPADVYLEGSDQYRGWFNSSLTTAVAINGSAPYKTVVTHGFTVDADGKKLSKSKGNYVALDTLVADYGADILRLWVCSADFQQEVSISDEIMRRISDTYRRIRNTARFLLANLFDFDPQKDALPAEQLVALDAWAIKRAQQIQAEVIDAYDTFDYHVIYQKVHHFCSIDMGSFYLDIIKDRQYTLPKNSAARRSCQTAMYHIAHALTRWLAPVLSFTAEEIWQYIPGVKNDSVFLNEWYDAFPDVASIDMAFWSTLQPIRDEVNRALEMKRKEGVIGSGLVANVTLYAGEGIRSMLESLEDELRFLLITSNAKIRAFKEAPNHSFQAENLELAIVVDASEDPKCTRCWHRQPDVGSHADHPDLCHRCVNNITGIDEIRSFV